MNGWFETKQPDSFETINRDVTVARMKRLNACLLRIYIAVSTSMGTRGAENGALKEKKKV